MSDGIRMPNVDPGVIDEFVGLATAGGQVSTKRATADQVAQRLLAEGPLKQALDGVTAGLNWIDEGWSSGVAFARGDAVAHNARSYRCTTNHTSASSTEPGVGANWATRWSIILEDANAEEVFDARQGETSLSANLTAIKGEIGEIDGEVTAARQGETSLAANLTAIKGDIAVKADRSEVHALIAPSDDEELAHSFSDRLGFFDLYVTKAGALRSAKNFLDIQGLSIVRDGSGELVFTDEAGFILWHPSLAVDGNSSLSIPLLGDVLCGVEGLDTNLFVGSFTSERSFAVRATVLGESGEGDSGQGRLRFLPEALGATATVTTHPENWDGLIRSERQISVKVASNPGTGSANILMIGDSILNYEQPARIKALLEDWGYTPTFIGTIPSSADRQDPLDTNGPLCEGRPTWHLRQYTNDLTGKTILPIGSESTYLSGSKAYKSDRNPFLRPEDDDDPDIVRGGYVLDFSDTADGYQGRFGLATPDIVVLEPLVNDLNALSEGAVYSEIYENELLLLKRLRAGWPGATILRIAPNWARDGGSNDARWGTRFVPALAALRAAHADFGDGNTHIISTWAHMMVDAGYSLADGSMDPGSGVTTATIGDRLHPVGGAIQQLAIATSAAIACVIDGKL